ncbi:PREDICTED: uncharacterized protein LOC109461677 [Branchiostoma belcheri]|uniref:Uncharacterized protein LOC109461677 n=1 Tax=Branchiostoma belcheri TaxID=7741 RepID=A0A6P4XAZ3_BRABE|nr:PREDICTED: uncharacterized protein LOC109461677 [Branchiostoma belcheri]
MENFLLDNYVDISNILDVKSVLPYLIQKRALTISDKERILHKVEEIDKAGELLDTLLRNGKCTPDIFIDALRQTDQTTLIDMLGPDPRYKKRTAVEQNVPARRPMAPQKLEAVKVTDYSITLQWTPAEEPLVGYLVEKRLSSAGKYDHWKCAHDGLSVISKNNKPQLTVPCFTYEEYDFRVRAMNDVDDQPVYSEPTVLRRVVAKLPDGSEIRIMVDLKQSSRRHFKKGEDLLKTYPDIPKAPFNNPMILLKTKEDGSVILVFSCNDLDSVIELWEIYHQGEVHQVMKRLFMSEDLHAHGVTPDDLVITINPEDFIASCRHLLLTHPTDKGFRVVRMGSDHSTADDDMLLQQEALKSLGDLYLKNGMETSNLSQLHKATPIYKRALNTCIKVQNVDGIVTLLHRIKYTEKMKEEMRKGYLALQKSDLDSAEQHFASALKLVHIRDPRAQQYKREVEPLCKLGDVYSKRGQQTGDGGNFVKAAALYNAAVARSEDQVLNGNIERAITEVEKSFLHCVLNTHSHLSQDNKERHKKQLKEMRDQVKLEMETIDQQLDPYVHDEDDPCVREIEAKRAQAVRQLFEKIAQIRKEFISLLVEECLGLMGPPPCKYALIGLGSQSTGMVTPYSDLQFVILVEEESEECLVYFRNLTHYLHLKVVNLGETILPALGIKSLNDFYSDNPHDNWYYDSVTPRGLAFDGSVPWASKTPLGRQGSWKEPPRELICTPENMASKLQGDAAFYLQERYHLATIFRNPCLIAGDQDLIDMYMGITGKILQADGGKMAQQLAQVTMREYGRSYNDQEMVARLIDVKKEIYRFPAVAVDCLALSSGIVPTTIWETIEEMEIQQVISPNNAHHLTVLTSISAELRLRTYIANGGQKENLAALASMKTMLNAQESSLQMIPVHDEVSSNALKPVFNLPNDKQLFRYYYTAVPLKRVLNEWAEERAEERPVADLYDSAPRVKGILYSELCKYRLAIRCYAEALKEVKDSNNDKMTLLRYLGDACLSVGDYEKAISLHEQALQMYRSIYGQTKAHPDIATSLSNVGLAWGQLGDYRRAISYYEQALQMYKSIYGQSSPHPDIATSLSKLGLAWGNLSDYRKAIFFYEQALEMYRGIFGTVHSDIANLLNNLGSAWHILSDYRKAIRYYEKALQMYRSIYGESTEHPNITSLLNNIGSAWHKLGEQRKAISYIEQALQMNRSIYGPTTPHPNIAISLINLGQAWYHLGHYRNAISYFEQALQMCMSIYGLRTPHSVIATSLSNLGQAWCHLADYRKAISYFEQALQMCRSIYGQMTAHPDIAVSLNNLSTAWLHLGDYKKAISLCQEALTMANQIYLPDKTHPIMKQIERNIALMSTVKESTE